MRKLLNITLPICLPDDYPPIDFPVEYKFCDAYTFRDRDIIDIPIAFNFFMYGYMCLFLVQPFAPEYEQELLDLSCLLFILGVITTRSGELFPIIAPVLAMPLIFSTVQIYTRRPVQTCVTRAIQAIDLILAKIITFASKKHYEPILTHYNALHRLSTDMVRYLEEVKRSPIKLESIDIEKLNTIELNNTDFCCTISQVLMKIPVRLNGRPYDYTALRAYFDSKVGEPKDPFNNDTVCLRDIQADRGVKSKIEDALKACAGESRLHSNRSLN